MWPWILKPNQASSTMPYRRRRPPNPCVGIIYRTIMINMIIFYRWSGPRLCVGGCDVASSYGFGIIFFSFSHRHRVKLLSSCGDGHINRKFLPSRLLFMTCWFSVDMMSVFFRGGSPVAWLSLSWLRASSKTSRGRYARHTLHHTARQRTASALSATT